MTFFNNNIPFSIDNYSLGLCDDHYIIGHFNNLSPEDQETVLTFLHYMEELKNSANDYTTDGNNIDAEYVFVNYTDDVVNTLTNHILATWSNTYQEQLTTIKTLNQLFKNNAYKTLFYKDLRQTPIEYLIKKDDDDQWVSDGIGCPAFDTYYDIDTIYWANLPEPPKPF